MSLINDVLRDLDRRQAKSARGSSGASGLEALPAPKKMTWWPWLAGAVLLGAVAQLIYMAWPLPVDTPPLLAPQVAGVERQPMLLASVADPELDTRTDSEDTPAVENPKPPAAQLVAPSTVGTGTSTAQVSPVFNETPAPQADNSVATVEVLSRPEPESVAEPAQQSRPPSEAPARIEIQRSPSREAEDPVDQALRAAARGQMGLAQSQLDNHLREAPDDTRARLLLAEVLVSQQRSMSARSVLAAGLNSSSAVELAPALARLVQTSDPAAARDVLLRYPPAPADAPDYHLLLAALHRQLGDHEQAAELYQRLTGIDPSNLTAWVGLGSSLESLGKPADARAAYEVAARGGDPRLSGFARQRLTALPVTGEQP